MRDSALKMEDNRSGQTCILSVAGRIDSSNSVELLERLKTEAYLILGNDDNFV